MDIIWNSTKENILKETRDISLEEISHIILEKKYSAVLQNPSHPNQMIFILKYKNYTFVVPFIIDELNNIVIKTAFPSRKFHALYGKQDENKT